jgi:hypothetical protein
MSGKPASAGGRDEFTAAQIQAEPALLTAIPTGPPRQLKYPPEPDVQLSPHPALHEPLPFWDHGVGTPNIWSEGPISEQEIVEMQYLHSGRRSFR